MNYCIIFNRLIILFYLLNAFVPFTSSLWSDEIKFDADDVDENFGIRSSKSPQWDRERSRSPSRSFDRSGDSSRPHELAKSNNSSPSVPQTMKEMEKAFIDIYFIYTDKLMWDMVVKNDTKRMAKTCTSAWENSAGQICESEPMPYKGEKGNTLKVQFKEEKKNYTLRTDFLKCRCRPPQMSKDMAKMDIPALYLAKYNESSVFLLNIVGNPHSLKLQISGMKNI